MRRIFTILLIVLVLLTGCQSKPKYATEPNAAFNQYLDETFVSMMEENIVNLYFSLTDYEQYGIEKPDVDLGSAGNEEGEIEEIAEKLKELNQFDYSSLDLKQQNIYVRLEEAYEESLNMAKYPEFRWIFTPSGSTYNTLSVFSEYKIKNKERLDDYLILLQDIDRMFKDEIELTKKRAELGVFMSDDTIDSTIDAIDRFISVIEDNQLIVTFNNKLDECDFLNEQEKASYQAENKRIVLEEVIPSYTYVKTSLLELKGSSEYVGGLAHYPKGKDYYRVLFESKTASNKSVDQVYKDLKDYMNNLILNAQASVMANDKLFGEYTEFEYIAQEPRDVIDTLMAKSVEYFVKGPEVVFEVSYLDESIAKDGVSAYYVMPELDTPKNNVIRINPKYNKNNPFEMYVTLAHEGYPGHMYQTTYYYDRLFHPIEINLNELGSVEGWAMYASLYAYDMLDLTHPATAELFKLDVRFEYALSAVVDIGIHYYGWTEEELAEELKRYSGVDFSDQMEIVYELYQSVVDDPGMMLSYGVGIMNYDNYYMNARSALKEKFDVKDFNQMLVEAGPVSFKMLDEYVASYIDENK